MSEGSAFFLRVQYLYSKSMNQRPAWLAVQLDVQLCVRQRPDFLCGSFGAMTVLQSN